MNIAKIGDLFKTIILWPHARGVPPVGADFGTRMSLEFLIVNKTIDVISLQNLCGTGLVLFIDERLNPTQQEINTVLDYASRNPARLIGVHGVEFDWQKGHVSVGRVYNALFFSMAVFHSYYLTQHASPIPDVLWNECFSVVLNVVVSEQSMLPPMVVGERTAETWMKPDVDLTCFKKLATRWQNDLPLVYSDLRFV
ncbi:hypothetical protein OESDEN_20469 [Oesophagostomum dentatum]|uniref:Glycosyl transferase 64 domain-containing protein n=1 Tax=Oesophagostomum dentatum TaxID=61180 RepID=A0A0B1S7I6_OESDE|nr:hypothetical protein OESDEN_20469 [Oesophagostomum dentatum]